MYLLLTCDEDHATEDSLAQRGEAQVYIISQAHHKLSLHYYYLDILETKV